MTKSSHPKASILILVIILLMTISVMGLLVMNYVKNMMLMSSNFFAYNKAYYLARGALELQLTKVAHRQYGYQDSLPASFVDSFSCYVGSKGIVSDKCAVTASIYAQGDYLTKTFGDSTCTDDNVITLEAGDAVGFPLFYDDDTGASPFATNPQISSINMNSNIQIDTPTLTSDEFGVALLRMEYDVSNSTRSLPTDQFSRTRIGNKTSINLIGAIDYALNGATIGANVGSTSVVYYLVIFNPDTSGNERNFCLAVAGGASDMPLIVRAVESLASFGHITVGLQSTQNIDLPGFIFSTFVNR